MLNFRYMSVSAYFRETLLGQTVRTLSGNRLFLYPEERSDFIIPDLYLEKKSSSPHGTSTAGASVSQNVNKENHEESSHVEEASAAPTLHESEDVEKGAKVNPNLQVEHTVDDDKVKEKSAAELALIASKTGDHIVVDCESRCEISLSQSR